MPCHIPDLLSISFLSVCLVVCLIVNLNLSVLKSVLLLPEQSIDSLLWTVCPCLFCVRACVKVADPDPGVFVGSGSGFQKLIWSRSALNIKVWNPSKKYFFLQYLLTEVIIQFRDINYIDFYVEKKVRGAYYQIKIA